MGQPRAPGPRRPRRRGPAAGTRSGCGRPAPAGGPTSAADSAAWPRSAAAAASDGRHVLEPGHAPALALVLGQRATATGCPCGPPARRRPAGRPTCGRWPPAATSRPATGIRPADCAASTSSGTPARPARLGHLRDRLDRADLVVGRLQAGQARCPGAARRRTPPGRPRPRRSTADGVTVPPSRSCSPRRAARWSAPPRSRPGGARPAGARAGCRARPGARPGCPRR